MMSSVAAPTLKAKDPSKINGLEDVYSSKDVLAQDLKATTFSLPDLDSQPEAVENLQREVE